MSGSGPPSTFARRHIDVTFKLGKGNFGESGSDTVKVTGLRASADVVKTGEKAQSFLELRIFGMTLDTMNKLSLLGKPLLAGFGRDNTIQVSAGSDGTGMGQVFSGTINQAWVDPNSMPHVPFTVTAYSGLESALKPIPPSSFNGPADVAVIMSGLASKMGVRFENSGVSVILSHPYLWGTAYSQAQQAKDAAGIEMIIDEEVLAIWPKGGTRNGTAVKISRDTGMVGYPTFTEKGIVVTTLFNPNIVYGTKIQVETDLTTAAGQWGIISVIHNLESETPGGQWFTHMQASILGHEPLGGKF